MELFAGALLLVGVVIIVWASVAFIRVLGKLWNTTPVTTAQNTPASDEIDGMNNGDYYNGPHGYSPMTGYPETQYGSGFNPDAEWNHEEED